MTKLTEAQRLAHRDDPAYSEGFYDAGDGTPIFDDAPEPYRAGWEAYWFCRGLLDKAGFTPRPDGSFSKTTIIPAGRQALTGNGRGE